MKTQRLQMRKMVKLWDILVAGPEQEEDNLGDIPEVFRMMWVLSPNGLHHEHHPHCHQTLTLWIYGSWTWSTFFGQRRRQVMAIWIQGLITYFAHALN